jgi:hypothetical protein
VLAASELAASIEDLVDQRMADEIDHDQTTLPGRLSSAHPTSPCVV